jgi:Nif-specific regulatory protein
MLLADFFIEKYSRQNHVTIRRISTPAIDLLMAYTGRGTCGSGELHREGVLLSVDEVIHSHHLRRACRARSRRTPPSHDPAEALENLERNFCWMP